MGFLLLFMEVGIFNDFGNFSLIVIGFFDKLEEVCLGRMFRICRGGVLFGV